LEALKMSRAKMCVAILSTGLLLAATGVAEGATAETARVSVDSNGHQANGPSADASVSAGGRYVAFDSGASNLVPGDNNGVDDVFVRDRDTGTTTRVSVSSAGGQANKGSYRPSISADGRFVSFDSGASNLVSGDTNNDVDVFVHNRTTGATTSVSVGAAGGQGNGGSYAPSISAGGRFVAFASDASNLVRGDTNGSEDVFVRDRQAGTTTRVSVTSNGVQANDGSSYPSISADGRYVAFRSPASNLVRGDTNRRTDVFVRDRQTRTTSRVSVNSHGHQANSSSFDPAISADGSFVVFVSSASNLVRGDTNGTVDVFVRNRHAGTTTRVNVRSDGHQANRPSSAPSISATGRYVAYRSGGSNLVAGDTNHRADVFLRDRTAGTTKRVSVRSNGGQSNGLSFEPSISANGQYVVFHSYASNLVGSDTNGMPDVFVRGPLH
jgi:Tol biopolymer transport system component